MKRFWKDVSVEDQGIRLDGRPVRTPLRAELILPNAVLAAAIADEWRMVGETIDPRAMPLTGLANAAIDRPPSAQSLSVYAESDLLCYRTDEPEDLVSRQAALWDPLLDWAQQRYDVAFTITTGIIHQAQPQATLDRLSGVVASLNPFVRTALQPIVTISGSLIIALALLDQEIAVADAFSTAHLDELWQAEQWGEDDWAIEARAARERDFLAAAQFLTLLD